VKGVSTTGAALAVPILLGGLDERVDLAGSQVLAGTKFSIRLECLTHLQQLEQSSI